MAEERLRYFTALDLIRELAHIGFIAGGCYIGWHVGSHFLAMFAGGVGGRIIWVAISLAIRARIEHDSQE